MEIDQQRIITALGGLAIVIVAYYLWKHGELGSAKEMVDEAAKDAKDAAKNAKDAVTGKK